MALESFLRGGDVLRISLTQVVLLACILPACFGQAHPAHKESPIALLRSGATLWISNVLVFALWYWRLDAGGPYSRGLRPGHTEGAFLFPQMTMPVDLRKERWSPMFIDYLFLAFNTSTALSPTDVPILSRWAKIMVMIQALISLTVTVILVARAVNIL